jgi:hypothetical protein
LVVRTDIKDLVADKSCFNFIWVIRNCLTLHDLDWPHQAGKTIELLSCNSCLPRQWQFNPLHIAAVNSAAGGRWKVCGLRRASNNSWRFLIAL